MYCTGASSRLLIGRLGTAARASIRGESLSLFLHVGDVGVVRDSENRNHTPENVVPRHRNGKEKPTEEEDEDGFHVTDDLEGQRAKGSDAHVLRNIHPDGQQTRRGEKGDGFTRPVILGDEAPGEQLIQERPDGEHGERHERRRLS